MFVDEVEDQLFIYEGSDVTVHSFAEVMNCLETVNVSTSRRDGPCHCSNQGTAA